MVKFLLYSGGIFIWNSEVVKVAKVGSMCVQEGSVFCHGVVGWDGERGETLRHAVSHKHLLVLGTPYVLLGLKTRRLSITALCTDTHTCITLSCNTTLMKLAVHCDISD